MDYINSGKADGATIHLGGEREGTEGYFIKPTIFTDTKPDMKIVREEIFGPVGVIIKFNDEEGEDEFYLIRNVILTTMVRRRHQTGQ
jgi:aldehyde dehydrogenase (NAD+)